MQEGIVGNRKAGGKHGIFFPVQVDKFQGVPGFYDLVAHFVRAFQCRGLVAFRNEHDVAVFLQRK